MSQDRYVPRYKQPQKPTNARGVAENIINDGFCSPSITYLARAYIELEKHHTQTLERHKNQMQELIQQNIDLANKLLELSK